MCEPLGQSSVGDNRVKKSCRDDRFGMQLCVQKNVSEYDSVALSRKGKNRLDSSYGDRKNGDRLRCSKVEQLL